MASTSGTSIDTRIRQVRSVVTLFIGAATACVGAVTFPATAGESWGRLMSIAYLLISGGCFTSWALLRTNFVSASELVLIITALGGIVAVTITGPADIALLASLGGLNVFVLLPGVAIRERKYTGQAILVLASAGYVLNFLARLTLRDDDPPNSLGQILNKVITPLTSFGLTWLMARARADPELRAESRGRLPDRRV